MMALQLHVYLFSFIMVSVSYFAYQKYMSVYPSIVLKSQKRYDYIIVGAGTAGCVLAARLSEDPDTRVLLIEAGDHMSYFTKIPLTATAAQQGPNDWSVKTTRQKYSSFGMWNQTSIIPRGKGFGGSGQINFLLHGFGFPQDFDRWTHLGFKHWAYKDLKPYFLKAFGTTESVHDSEITEVSEYCADDGRCFGVQAPMQLKLNYQDELMQVFKKASALLNDKDVVFKQPAATIRRGIRHSTFDAYLKPAMERKNLDVLLKTQGVSIRFVNRKASSIYILQNRRDLDNIFVSKEIIISAGTIMTPQLLIRSGIGPKEVLQRLKLKAVAENEHVGQNFHDHMNMPLYVSIQKPLSVTLSKVFSAATLWEYFWMNKGYLSFPPVAGVEYRNTSAVMLFSMGTASERLLRDLSNYRPEVFRNTFVSHNATGKEGFMFLTTCVQPRSRGSVTLQDTTTHAPPVVDPNYLQQHWDVRCIIRAIRRAEQLTASKPFQEIGAKIHWPRPERCMSLWSYSYEDQLGAANKKRKNKKTKSSEKSKQPKVIKESPYKLSPPDAYLECIIREVAVTGHHASGTCAGGKVVDSDLKVKAVSGVRIVDASVLPSPISLFPNSVLVAMAERAADLIREDTRSH